MDIGGPISVIPLVLMASLIIWVFWALLTKRNSYKPIGPKLFGLQGNILRLVGFLLIILGGAGLLYLTPPSADYYQFPPSAYLGQVYVGVIFMGIYSIFKSFRQ